MRSLKPNNDAPAIEVKRRLAVCESCEHLKTIAGMHQCGKCGCIKQAKVRFKNAKCPLEKW